jgi:hypothetical protein
VEVKNPIAYFTGILNKKFQERYFEELYDMQVVKQVIAEHCIDEIVTTEIWSQIKNVLETIFLVLAVKIAV